MFNIHPIFKSHSGMGERRALPEQTQREERLRFIARELHHRTKNMLAIVQAISNQIGSRSARA